MLHGPQPAPMEAFNLRDYRRLVVFHNPKSSNADATEISANLLKQRLAEVSMSVEITKTELWPDDMANKLGDKTREGDALAILSGDGGTSHFLSAVMAKEIESPVAILGGGQANDMAHMLHSRRQLARPLGLLTTPNATVGRLHPLEISAQHANQKMSWLGFGYFGVGMTGVAAEHFNDPDLRAKMKEKNALQRMLAETKGALASIDDAPTLSIDGEYLLERNFVNGFREAKHARFKGVDFLGPDAAVMPIPDRESAFGRRLAVALALKGAALGNITHLLNAVNGINLPRSFDVHSTTGEVPTQTDGEPQRFLSGTHFEVGISQRSVAVVTTRR